MCDPLKYAISLVVHLEILKDLPTFKVPKIRVGDKVSKIKLTLPK